MVFIGRGIFEEASILMPRGNCSRYLTVWASRACWGLALGACRTSLSVALPDQGEYSFLSGIFSARTSIPTFPHICIHFHPNQLYIWVGGAKIDFRAPSIPDRTKYANSPEVDL